MSHSRLSTLLVSVLCLCILSGCACELAGALTKGYGPKDACSSSRSLALSKTSQYEPPNEREVETIVVLDFVPQYPRYYTEKEIIRGKVTITDRAEIGRFLSWFAQSIQTSSALPDGNWYSMSSSDQKRPDADMEIVFFLANDKTSSVQVRGLDHYIPGKTIEEPRPTLIAFPERKWAWMPKSGKAFADHLYQIVGRN